MGIPKDPNSDIQVLARILRATRRGDQITSAEAHTLDQIADHGYVRKPFVPEPEQSRIDPGTLESAIGAGGTRL